MDGFLSTLAAVAFDLAGWIGVGALLLLGVLVIVFVGVFLTDVLQTKHAIRRNYPVLGRFRYFFEHMGKFFRQYFFAMDREELPFNRAQRSWVYRAAKNLDTMQAFGSTRDLTPRGTVLFVNCAFPKLKKDFAETGPVTIGAGCRHPFEAASIFNISGMSYGALSRPAIEALSKGAAQCGAWLNTGEGGLSESHLSGGCDLVFQIGTANYGVRDDKGGLCDGRLKAVAEMPQVRMFEIKLSQGAKPGKGGILPGCKVTPEIAETRGIPEDRDSISPNRRHDAGSVEELLDLIRHIRDVTGKPVGFKTVIGDYAWLESLREAIQRRGIACAPDFITIDSADGGSGAAPMALMDYMGLPLRESLPMVVDILYRYGLSARVRVIASGKMITPADVAWALCVGADFVVSARGFMFALGCIQSLKCHKNTCPTGVATHNPRLQRGLVPEDKAERVAHYKRNVEHGLGVIAHSCGISEPRALRRYHARVVMADGLSKTLDQIYPEHREAAL